MEAPWNSLNDIWEHFRAPKVNEQKLNRLLGRVRRELPSPVFWLLGKAQSGKTSIVRTLTGSDLVEIGNGFRPCTRRAELYAFPNEAGAFVRFLDTRGLGEVEYDPAEDIQVLENQSHCLMVVIKAMDHAQRGVLEPLGAILKSHPDWPLIVVQTALHEGYSEPCTPHAVPYPYEKNPFPAPVPAGLARSLLKQREWFTAWGARFVPVDFTLPEDGYHPEHYGLDALWGSIEEAVPLGLRAMLGEHRKPFRDAYFRTAQPHVVSYAVIAGGAAGLPIPRVDVPLLIAIQAKMFHSIASIYGQELSAGRMGEIAGTLGIGFAVRMGGRELLKLIPGLGSAVAALFAAASTYALGCTLCAYFSIVRRGDVPDAVMLRKLYEEEYVEGRRRLKTYMDSLVHGSGK